VPTGEPVRVDPEDLDAHARHLSAVGDQIGAAARAGRSVRLRGDACGQLCALMPVLIDQVQRVLVDGIDVATGSVHGSADRVRTAAERYRAADERAAARLDRPRRSP
jgi:hypothetical protein